MNYQLFYGYNMLAEKSGQLNFKIELYSLQYFGCDKSINLTITTNSINDNNLFNSFIKNRFEDTFSEDSFFFSSILFSL